ncbi:MAG: O-antigen ligase family protein [Acidaminococcaceae bacterium]|jgi:O-antigen ligase|nr:O-antigen ligase family protein [Acidaminococcaceae bacterium]
MTIQKPSLKNLQLEQIVYGLLVLLIFVLPFSAIAGGVVFVLCFLAAIINGIKTKNFRPECTIPKQIKYPLWALFILSGLSVFLSWDIKASAFNWLWVVGQEAGVFYLVLKYAAKRHRCLLLMKVFLLSAGIVALYGIWQYAYGSIFLQDKEWVDQDAFPTITKRAFSTLENPNILGTFLVMTIAYCAGIFAPLRGGKTRIGLILIFLLSAGCLLLTFSRGNWLAVFWVLVVFAAFFYHKAILPLVGGGATVLYFGWNILSKRILSIFETQDTSAELRFSYIESALAMIKDHPWGVGWYGYQYAFVEYDFMSLDGQIIMYHCHNLFLNIAAELGIAGLILFLYIMWHLFKLARNIRHRNIAPWARGIACGYMAALVGIGISGLTDHTLFNIQLGMLFWTGNAIILLVNYRYGTRPVLDKY